MRRFFKILTFLLYFLLTSPAAAEETEPVASWSLDSLEAFQRHGKSNLVSGVEGKSVAFDGRSLLVAPDSAEWTSGDEGFTLTAWVNPYALHRDQQMIVAKNRYSLGERQWGVMIDADNQFRLYVWQGKWLTVESKVQPELGHWHQVGIVVRPGSVELWVNGELGERAELARPLVKTEAPITLAGINDNGHIRQTLFGALDEVKVFDRPLSQHEMKTNYSPVSAVHDIPEPPKPVIFWNPAQPMQTAANTVELPDVRFQVIKPYEFKKDGYRFLHGVALAFHKGRLYASFGHNQGGENTDTEQARVTYSEDEGRTWSDLATIDSGPEPEIGVSHGVFLAHAGKLWAFQGSYSGTLRKAHTRAYVLDEASQSWRSEGVIIEGGFWPMQEPQRMANGKWIMSGLRAGGENPAAVAISDGDDLTQWQLVVIPRGPGIGKMWGESTVILQGKKILNISRYGGEAKALLATSEDYGLTWTPSLPSNLPMATSKPYAGTLSTGQHYLICATTSDGGGRRSPLTIAVSRPGETLLSKVFVIRQANFPEGPGESHPKASLAYPYAIEHEGQLYVGYSNNGGNVGRVGTGRELMNNNSAELAVIPIRNLHIE